MKRFTCMLVMVCLLTASAALAGEQSQKAEAYAKIRANIEKARAATEYDKKFDAYSRALVGVEANSYRGDISCDDPELPEIYEAITAIESELLEMYEMLEAAGTAPQFKPKTLETCQQVVSNKANAEKARAEAAEKRKTEAAASGKASPQSQRKSYISLRDDRNQEVGRIYEDGAVHDEKNAKIGVFEADGAVKNGRNYKIGAIESDGTVKNERNYKIGAIEPDGTVKNDRNYKIGAIEADGTVKNDRNYKIGMAPGVKKEWAAAFFLFNLFK